MSHPNVCAPPFVSRRSLPLMTALGLALSTSTACMDPTEVVIFADTTLGVPCQVETLRIEVQGSGDAISAEAPASDGLASWTISKSAGPLGLGTSGGDVFDVRVFGLRGGEVVAQANGEASFSDRSSQEIHLVLTEDCLGTTCDLGSSTLRGFTGPEPSARTECVLEVKRYEFEDQSLLVNIIDACTFAAGTFQSFTTLNNDDELVDDPTLSAFLAEEFTFEFYGEVVDRVWVSDDGYISFGTNAEGATFDTVTNTEGITSAGHPENAVLGFWENLSFTQNGELCVAVQSSGGIDTLWATWKNGCLGPACATGDRIEFSIGLEEQTNRVILGFTTMVSATEPDRAAGGQAVVGIVGPDGTNCSASECSEAGLCADGETPCGFTQVFSRAQQAGTWPTTTWVFTPIAE